MPLKRTEPIPDLLVRRLEDPDTINTLELYAEALDEVVDFGTHILFWECDREEDKFYRLPVIAYFRQILELIDAISVLLRSRAVPPCVVLMRSLFESTLGLEYMLKEDSKRRGQCYFFFDHAKQLTFDQHHDPSHESYKEYKRLYHHSQLIGQVPIIENLKERIQRGQDVLNHPEHIDIKEEYRRLKTLKRSFD